ncbi:MAG: hypothetical protein MH208_09915 [Marinobacter sp.]|nr:hypothetical protein [Marinobacter sp.]
MHTHFTDRLVQSILGIEIPLEHLSGKLKATQNQPERNREGVRQGLIGAPGAMAGLIPGSDAGTD